MDKKENVHKLCDLLGTYLEDSREMQGYRTMSDHTVKQIVKLLKQAFDEVMEEN